MTRKHNSKKYTRGGNQDVPEVDLTPPPFVTEPLKYGATSPAEEAILHQQIMNENQQRMNDGLPPLEQTGGGEGIVVPQIDTPLPSSPTDANAMAVKMNELLLQQNADSQFDGQVGKVVTGGSRRRTRRHTSVRKYRKNKTRQTKKTKKTRKHSKKSRKNTRKNSKK